ncbi:MAG: hypothetical protein PWP31_1670 [Clostridia bacterium]|nr:hypothetical protein [Clostridia bacterium]
MYVGLDMGGTHTDTVLIKDGKVIRHSKTPTNNEDFLSTISEALENILYDINPTEIERINLSTTVCTNAIVTGKTDPVGMLIEPGPGVNVKEFECGAKNFILAGAIDHRGRPTGQLKPSQIKAADKELQRAGIKHLAIVSKFSTRNPEHELKIKETLSPSYDFITLGHRISGQLNFPRRIYTAYYNSAVSSTYKFFANAISTYMNKKHLNLSPHILKADGGTISLDASIELPVETILAGPSASIMGALALAQTSEDTIILDIGGTTTDIAFLVDGVPLFVPKGINIEGYPTLVRALYSHSLGVGGDSYLKIDKGRLIIGPERLGKAKALGGPTVTPTDALITLGDIDLGDKKLAKEGITQLGFYYGLNTKEMAKKIIDDMTSAIVKRTKTILNQINSRPVYTVREMIEDRKITPHKVIVIGAPAKALAHYLEASFGLPVIVPSFSEVANAIGTALSQPTTELTLIADTEQGTLIVPEEGIREKIPPNFSLSEARQRALELLEYRIKSLNPDTNTPELEVIEEQSFNMVSGFFTTGKNIRVKVQVKPQVNPLKRGDKNV